MARWLKAIDDVLKVKVHHLQTGRIKNSEFIDWVDKQPTAEPKQEWISVKDRMPEKMEWVLCACRGNIIEVLRYDHIMDDWDTTMPNRGYFKNFVTHWMPLPEPPKEGE